MTEKKRARRIRDRERLKAHWYRHARNYLSRGDDGSWITGKYIGNMFSTHGKRCSKTLCCGNRRRFEGPTIGERRRMQDDGSYEARLIA